MTGTALVTGASSGIGLEIARYHARQGGDVVLVARREAELNALKAELESTHGVKVGVVVADLASPSAADEIFAATLAQGFDIDILVNNAGFGGHGKFHEQPLERHQRMIQVNITSLVNLTYRYLPRMVEKNHGRILHVASTAAFLPGPLQAVYYASKAFVVSFSQAIAEELSGTNVTSTALCPGATATGFEAAGDLEGIGLWDNAESAASVGACGYEAMRRGELVKINEPRLAFMLNWVMPLLPRKVVLKSSRRSMEKH